MMMMIRAIYAGSFDPITLGHQWVIEQGATLFDELVVAFGVNPAKNCDFTLDERLDMLSKTVEHLPNIEIDTYLNKYLINYAQQKRARFILRGIRNEGDYAYERTMRNINGDLDKSISTIFLMPPRDLAEVSSSMVKSMVGPEGWENIVSNYLPSYICRKFKEKYNG
jgi:pantetheine-phosphate adenylyltransferase